MKRLQFTNKKHSKQTGKSANQKGNLLPSHWNAFLAKKKKGERKRIEGKLANGQRLNDD